MRTVLRGFRDFVVRGNAIDLAVGVVIGAAFSAVVTAIVDGLITPLLAAVFGEADLSGVGTFTVNGAQFSIGLVLNAVFTFLCVATALYLVVVLPMTKLRSLRRPKEAASAATPEDVELLREIRDLLADTRDAVR